MVLRRMGMAAALAGLVLGGVPAAHGQASEPGREPEAAPQEAPAEPRARAPQPPPGMFVLPRQPQAIPVPPSPPQGCTYQENKLELLV